MFPSKVMFNGVTLTQGSQERELDRLANDNARDGGRNTSERDAAGGARGHPPH